MPGFEATGLRSEQIVGYEVLHDTIGLLRGDGIVPANSRKVRVGDLVAKNSSTGKFQVRKSTEMRVQGVNTDTVIAVVDSHPWTVGDAIIVVGESADVVSSVDYDLNTITLVTGLTGTRAVGVVVETTTNNQDDAVGIHIGWDIDSKDYDQTIAPAYRGNFLYDKIRNFDAAARTDLGGISKSAFNVYSI